MEHRRRRPRKRQPDTRLILLGLIAVLVIILMIVICIAIGTAKNPETPTEPSTSNTTTAPGTSGTSTPTQGTTLTTAPGDLVLDAPQESHTVVVDESFHFRGKSDAKLPLTVNGSAVFRAVDGSFDHEVKLTPGINSFEVNYNGEIFTYTVEYRYVVEYFSPSEDTAYGSGATVFFEVSARDGSQVSVTFNGTTVNLSKGANQSGFGASEGFTIYVGEYTLTNTNTSDLNLGQVIFTAAYNGVTETYTSGMITCQKSTQILGSDPSVTPSSGGYQDVGSGYIGEVINYSAETMYSWDNMGYSHPVNNYLPQGTMDYVSTEILTGGADGTNQFRQMRCGWRVFTKKNNPPAGKTTVLNCYIGTLPDHNEIGFVSMQDHGQYSVMTLNTMWKAPFRFVLEAQDYANPNGGGSRSYQISNFTSTYIDITFCYATVFNGEVTIPAGNPIFSHGELTQNASDCTLRLYFKKAGGFYGWDAYYNENGQLCFKFLNPPTVQKADNAYGVDLSGLKIMLDVGHGGTDGGTVGYTSGGVRYTEAERNLNLSLLLKLQK